MSKKYRIKLKNGRLLGPFSSEQVGELYLKGHIEGDEECQIFPTGSWHTVQDFEELSNLILDIINERIGTKDLSDGKDDITVAKMSLDRLKAKDEPIFEEFQYQKKTQTGIDYKKLEEEYKKRVGNEKELRNVDETKVINRKKDEKFNKTVVVNPNPFRKKDNQKEKEQQPKEENKEKIQEVIDTSEKTQLIDTNQLAPVVVEQVKEVESALAKAKGEKKEKVQRVKEISPKVGLKRKGMKPVVALAFLVLLYFLFFEEEPQGGNNKLGTFNIIVPIAQEYESAGQARKFLQSAREAYNRGTFRDKIEAIEFLIQSVSHQYRNNDALGLLILTYAELYPNVVESKKRQSAINLYKIIQTASSKRLKDINVALGTALFFYHIKKYKSAVHVIENYLRVSQSSRELFILYLKALMESGELTKARKAFEQVEKIVQEAESKGKDPPKGAYLALSGFHDLNENRKKSRAIIKNALKRNPHSIPLLIKFADLKMEEIEYLDLPIKDPKFLKKFKEFIKIVKAIEALQWGGEAAYYARFLEFSGMISAIQGDNQTAVKLFKTALRINHSNSLRSKLAALELGGEKSIESLIRESKILELMKLARKLLKEKKWKQAFTFAFNAVELNPNHIPAQLLLAEVQIGRGYFENVIESLNELRKVYSKNKSIYVALINAYIRAKKMDDAYQNIVKMGLLKGLRESPEFASLQGQFYMRDGNHLIASKWFNESILRDPLRDKDYFDLAKIYIINKSYTKAKTILSSALEIDPTNVNYHTLYANILYELDSVEAAIGYLRKMLEQYKDSPKLIGDIAIYYYRNGQIKEFEEYRKKFEKLNPAEASFYAFLVRASVLEDKYKDAIKYSELLLQVDPSDIESRMRLGKFLYEQKFYGQSVDVFKAILDRLSSFPGAYYYLAKIYLEQKKIKLAITTAEKEIAGNPTLYHGYYILGEIYRNMGKWQLAIKNLEKAISINNRAVEALVSLGWINMRQNFMEKARELYLRAKREEQNNPEVRKQLGLIYKAIGQRGLASEEFNIYLKLKPDASDRRDIEFLMRSLRQ